MENIFKENNSFSWKMFSKKLICFPVFDCNVEKVIKCFMLFGLHKKSLIFIVIPNNYMMYNGQHKLFLYSKTIKSQNVRSLKSKKY